MGGRNLSVDAFVETRVLPQYRPVVQMLRDLMCQLAPDVEECIFRGIPAFKRKCVLAVVSPTKTGITFSLAKGASMEDKYGLLEGPSATTKTIKIKSAEAANKDALKYYIKQAIALDSS